VKSRVGEEEESREEAGKVDGEGKGGEGGRGGEGAEQGREEVTQTKAAPAASRQQLRLRRAPSRRPTPNPRVVR